MKKLLLLLLGIVFLSSCVSHKEKIARPVVVVRRPKNLSLVRQADIHAEKGEFKRAEEKLLEAIEDSPNSSHAKYKLGWLYHDYLRYDRAISVFEELVKKDSRHYCYHISLADFYRHIGKYDRARAEWKKGIRIDPFREWGYRMLGLILADEGKYDDAIRWFKKAVKVEPDNAGAHRVLGWNGFLAKEQFDEAISEFQKAIELEPDEVSNAQAMACAYFLKGEYDRAQEWHKKAIEMDPDAPETYCQFAELYTATGDFGDAEAMISRGKALSKKPKQMIYSSFMETLVKVLSEKEYDQALNELLALMNQGKYFNLRGNDLRVLERTVENYTLDSGRKKLAQRLILLVKGEIEPSRFQ